MSVHALYLAKFLVVTFLFLRHQSATSLIPCNSQLFRGAQIQPELCFDLLQGSCPLFFFFGLYPFRDFAVAYGFVSNLHL